MSLVVLWMQKTSTRAEPKTQATMKRVPPIINWVVRASLPRDSSMIPLVRSISMRARKALIKKLANPIPIMPVM